MGESVFAGFDCLGMDGEKLEFLLGDVFEGLEDRCDFAEMTNTRANPTEEAKEGSHFLRIGRSGPAEEFVDFPRVDLPALL
jgi:hypothetical protein